MVLAGKSPSRFIAAKASMMAQHADFAARDEQIKSELQTDRHATCAAKVRLDPVRLGFMAKQITTRLKSTWRVRCQRKPRLSNRSADSSTGQPAPYQTKLSGSQFSHTSNTIGASMVPRDSDTPLKRTVSWQPVQAADAVQDAVQTYRNTGVGSLLQFGRDVRPPPAFACPPSLRRQV